MMAWDDSTGRIRRELEAIQSVLKTGLMQLDQEETESLLRSSVGLLGRMDTLDGSCLTVGLLGGTGVGKSTLANALAGAEITSAGHRRPLTEDIIIYRHVNTALPSSIAEVSAPWRESVHEVESIRQVILCDLPDFDSISPDHRESVRKSLSFLDLLIWVTSLEKYADERFHATLRSVPKSRRNFRFVLNKADILFNGRDPEAGYHSIHRVKGSFLEHLAQSGNTAPPVYVISASAALHSSPLSPWNEFDSLRRDVFLVRESKEIASIKSSNLDIEVDAFRRALAREISNSEMLEAALIEAASDLEAKRSDWVAAGRHTVSKWLGANIDSIPSEPRAAALTGAGRGVEWLVSEWRRRMSSAGRELLPKAGDDFLAELTGSYLTCLTHSENLLAHRLLRGGLSKALPGVLDQIFLPLRTAHTIPTRTMELLSARRKGEIPRSGVFTLVQRAVYMSLFLLLLLSLGGENASGHFFREPGFSSSLGLVTAIASGVFSPAGLAAVLSYLLLRSLIGIRFYAHYRKTLQRRTQRFIESLTGETGELWGEQHELLVASVRSLATDVAERRSMAKKIIGGDPEDRACP